MLWVGYARDLSCKAVPDPGCFLQSPHPREQFPAANHSSRLHCPLQSSFSDLPHLVRSPSAWSCSRTPLCQRPDLCPVSIGYQSDQCPRTREFQSLHLQPIIMPITFPPASVKQAANSRAEAVGPARPTARQRESVSIVGKHRNRGAIQTKTVLLFH